MINLKERFGRFNSSDVILSYVSKLMFGLGLGAILSAYLKPVGLILIVIAVFLSIPIEIKFWKSS